MVKMVTQHGKNLAAGLSKNHLGRYLMSKVFNVKQEPISFQLPREPPRQQPRPPQQPMILYTAVILDTTGLYQRVKMSG